MLGAWTEIELKTEQVKTEGNMTSSECEFEDCKECEDDDMEHVADLLNQWVGGNGATVIEELVTDYDFSIETLTSGLMPRELFKTYLQNRSYDSYHVGRFFEI
jgi:hypothetical protein